MAGIGVGAAAGVMCFLALGFLLGARRKTKAVEVEVEVESLVVPPQEEVAPSPVYEAPNEAPTYELGYNGRPAELQISK